MEYFTTAFITQGKVFHCPSALRDESYGMHEFVTVNGIKLHCVISGPEDAPVMLMLHGFPEFWYSWRYQIREFNRDYRVVAVDLRGYGESDKPLDTNAYTIPQLVSDIIELISSVCKDKCVLVAHDWGGIIAWRVVYQRPDLISKYIVLCCPHPRRYIELAKVDLDTMLRQWYVLLFQVSYIPEVIIRAGDYLFLKDLFSRPESGLVNTNRMDDDTISAFIYTFSQKNALKCPLYYYKTMFARDPNKNTNQPRDQKIQVSTLLMMGVYQCSATLYLPAGKFLHAAGRFLQRQ